MSNFNIEVGQRLFKARKELKMSRAELGRKLNLHETTIKRYEDGQIKALDIEKMKEFSKALDIEAAYLMGWGYIPAKVKPIDLFAGHSGRESHLLKELIIDKIIKVCGNLNQEGKHEAFKRIEELTYIPKYSNNNTETMAAHNDFVHEKEELYKIKEDIDDMKNW